MVNLGPTKPLNVRLDEEIEGITLLELFYKVNEANAVFYAKTNPTDEESYRAGYLTGAMVRRLKSANSH